MTGMPAAMKAGSLWCAVVEDLERGGGNAVPRHELLREGLAPLDRRRSRRRSEDVDSLFAQTIGQSGDQRGFGAHDHEVVALGRGVADQAGDVVSGDRQAARVTGDSRVAGSACEIMEEGAPAESPREGRLATAAADEKNLQLVTAAA